VRGAQRSKKRQATSEQQPVKYKKINKNSIMPMPHNVINLLTLSKRQTIKVGILKNLERIFDRSAVAQIAHEWHITACTSVPCGKNDFMQTEKETETESEMGNWHLLGVANN